MSGMVGTLTGTVGQAAPALPLAPTGGSIDTQGMLNMSEKTQQFVLKIFAATVCLIFIMITAVMCVRVAVDGNAPLTAQITSALVGMVPWLAAAVMTPIVGKTVASVVISKITGTAVTL